MPKGVSIGLRNVVYAKLATDPSSGTATYSAPQLLSGAISANINPNSSNDTLFADDGPYEVATTLGGVSLELNVADLSLEVQADLFGHTMSGGVLIRKSSDIPPWVAVGFKSLKSNGKYRYTWLAKGKFTLPEQNNETKGDNAKFTTPTAKGTFVKRECDDEWERHIDEDSPSFVQSLATNWFNTPYGAAADATVPTVSSVVPANNATAVAATSSVVWNFNEAINPSSINATNFVVFKDIDGTNVAGTLAANANYTQVTFTPSANLAAATAYRAVITSGVTDLAGNAITGSVTKFTTA
jgi:phi13 family phage major tail protein